MESLNTEKLTFTQVQHLPIVKHYARKIKLVETLDAMVDSQMELPPGLAVMAMVQDTLSGRTPLYRLKETFEEKDTELLLGHKIESERFGDYNLARVLDKIYETGTQRIFTQIAQNAIGSFSIDTSRLHYDTTSISVYGDYDATLPFNITYGHSKDKRPDLKQFLVSMLCVDRDIPIIGAPKDGNASDKTLNNELLAGISRHMAGYGIEPGAFIYVADAALVTPDNLAKADEQGIKLLSRLPATYKECSRVIREAVVANNWTDIGTLTKTRPTKKRPAAYYRVCDSRVELYDRIYRAIVVHSTAHDKRRHKRIDRILTQKRKALQKLSQKTIAAPFYCEADARQAGEKLCSASWGSYHRIEYKITPVPRYGRGRPPRNKKRVPKRIDYQLETVIREDSEAIEPLRLEAGCFVLICNLTDDQEIENWPAEKLLSLYKDQNGIEKNFGFLKDPVIVNSIFLKKPHRIEVLGLILLISLLIWRLMERSMRRHVKASGPMTGWENRPTKKPTSFMMTTKFIHILVVKSGDQRQLAKPLKPVQLEYLKALNVDPRVFTSP